MLQQKCKYTLYQTEHGNGDKNPFNHKPEDHLSQQQYGLMLYLHSTAITH